ncbi:MAG: 50S ribosomal protein L24 [Gammaproteobacteria bacterium HGW-Gammaproteobacteria-8]|nr:MAG: 50S ribosomal protein L24 [Gammaproteobacteria bacterium HGW-Gammaproteobacteria-8]
MQRIRKGDEVIVIAGRSKGQRGHVLRVLGEERMLVENVNMIKRHTKPDPQRQQPGGIVEREAPIHVSNVMLYNPATDRGDRVGYKVLEDGRKVRVFRSTGEVVDI